MRCCAGIIFLLVLVMYTMYQYVIVGYSTMGVMTNLCSLVRYVSPEPSDFTESEVTVPCRTSAFTQTALRPQGEI